MDRTIALIVSLTFGLYSVAEAADPPPQATHCSAFPSIATFRQARLIASQTPVLRVNRVRYDVIGILGASTFTAYLAQSPKGEKRTLKYLDFYAPERPSPKMIDALYLDIARIVYFLELGHPTPNILDIEYNLDHLFIVKEYLEGVVYSEFVDPELPADLETNRTLILKAGLAEVRRLTQLAEHPRRGFVAWLTKNRRRLEAMYPVLKKFRRVLDRHPDAVSTQDEIKASVLGEVRPINMLYTEDARWILYDP